MLNLYPPSLRPPWTAEGKPRASY